MSSTVIHLIPPCPPPRIKSATQRVNKSSRPKPIDDDDLYDDKDVEEVPKKTTKTKKRGEPVIPIESEEEEEEIVVQKPKKTTKTKSKTVSKQKPKKKVVVEDDEEEEEEEEIRPPPKKNANKNKRPTTAQVSTKKKAPIREEEEEVDDYEGGNDDFEEELLRQHNKKKNPISSSTAPSTTKKKGSSNKKSESAPKTSSEGFGSLYKSNISSIGKRTQKSTLGDDKIGQVILGNVGKKFDLTNKKQINNAKNKMAELFATKKVKRQNTESTKEEEEEDKAEKEQEGEKFTNLLSKINNIDYKGYKYTLKDSDYFVNGDKKYMTILNSEDAAIKKCEEIYNSLGEKEKFIDNEFGSLPNDGGKQNKISLYSNDPVPAGNPNPSLIEWYPLTQICEDAKFFADGTESNDVVQGSLGDCWFVSALSVIATKDYLLRGEFSPNILDDGEIDDEENVMLSTGVYPPIFHSFRKKGIFCFRFFKNFAWRYVIIDDRLPCQKIFNKNQTPTLLYGKCRSRDEFWVPLIEKGYAKLHGSYRALVSGFIDDGLVDLTGLSAKKVMINEEDRKDPKKIEELWKLLMSHSTMNFGKKIVKSNSGKVLTSKYFTRNKSMMGCSVDPTGNKVEMEVILENQHTGILAGHAYSILDCFEIPKPRGKKPRKTSRLLRIRNPWGRKEWVGKWADDSEEVLANEERIREALNKKYEGTHEKISVNQEDGTFIMCFSDFRRIFNKLFICVNFPPDYIGIRYHGKWTKTESGGLPINNTKKEYEDFANNPQYYLEKENDGTVFISLLQNDGRLTGTKFPFPNAVRKACLLVFKTKNKQRVTDLSGLIDKTLIVQRRDLNLELNLPRGEYIIMPSTLKKGEVGDFVIEVYLEDKIISKGRKGEPFSFDRLKNTNMEKLGGEPAEVELIQNDRAEEINNVLEYKKEFMFAQFQNCLKDDDDANYEHGKGAGKTGGKVEEEEEDYDYDEF